MAKKKLFVSPDGTITAVLDTVLDGGDFGPKEITRQSNLDYNGTEWVAKATNGVIIATGPTRQETLKKEVQVVEAWIEDRFRLGKQDEV